jgi:PAS domain S-box-containing protein
MTAAQKTRRELAREIEALQARLTEAEELLYAIHSGQVDALVISGPLADQVFTLKGAEQPYRILIETINEGAVTLTPDGTILYSNRSFAELVETPLEQTLGTMIQRFVVPADRPAFEALLEQGRQDESSAEIVLQSRAGKHVPVLLSTRALQLDALRGVCMVVTDISRQKRVEEELRRSNADLEQFAYVASHDLQEPLRMVTSYVQLLQRHYQGQLDAEADIFIGYAVDGTMRMQTLIHDLLAYSQVGRANREHAPTDCARVLEQVQANLAVTLADADATITAGSLPTLLADASQIAQLFQNLISNAIKFHGAEPPQIHISATRRDREWVFAVRDNGIGIDPQYVERIFVIFQRLHTRAEYPGTGIGLAICKKIVDYHGGQMWIESQPGEGTTFLFTIPITVEVHDKPPPAPTSCNPGR